MRLFVSLRARVCVCKCVCVGALEMFAYSARALVPASFLSSQSLRALAGSAAEGSVSDTPSNPEKTDRM